MHTSHGLSAIAELIVNIDFYNSILYRQLLEFSAKSNTVKIA